jgi:phosphate transport system permease protein
MAITTTTPPSPASRGPRQIMNNRPAGDRRFRAMATAGGLTTLILLVLIGIFLLSSAWPALRHMGLHFFTTFEWTPTETGGTFGVGALLYWTVTIAVIAMIFAVPVSICIALFITEFAPIKIRRPLTSLVDLLAAIPSIIYGLWGFFFLMPRMVGIGYWLHAHLGFIPFFHADLPQFSLSAFNAGTVLAIMVVPIATSVMREVFSQAPPGEKEGALALGATRWGVIRSVVLPFGRGGIIGGSMLGLGRALGETIAVAFLISPLFDIRPSVIQAGANSIASNIFNAFGESFSGMKLSALMASGVVLFALTLTVNMLASMIVGRSRSGTGVEI